MLSFIFAIKLLYITFALVFKRTSRTSQQFDLQLHFSNESRNSNFSNQTAMGKIEFDAYRYSRTVVIVSGILGNILVILSILRQKKNMLNNNYYFLVLHLAFCDLAVLILRLFHTVESYWLQRPLSVYSFVMDCHGSVTEAFELTGIGMMLIISLLRYRATVHPLKPAISRRKLKIVCGLLYLVGVIAGGGTKLPLCFIKSTVLYDICLKFYFAFAIFFVYLGPTIFMAVVYYKIGRSLIKQNKLMKRVCSNVMRQREPDSSFNILRYIRNRRTFLVCLSTVLCYGITCIPASVWCMLFIVGKNRPAYTWLWSLSDVLQIAGSHSANALIYGILDKQLLTFSKCCCKKKRRTTEN